MKGTVFSSHSPFHPPTHPPIPHPAWRSSQLPRPARPRSARLGSARLGSGGGVLPPAHRGGPYQRRVARAAPGLPGPAGGQGLGYPSLEGGGGWVDSFAVRFLQFPVDLEMHVLQARCCLSWKEEEKAKWQPEGRPNWNEAPGTGRVLALFW